MRFERECEELCLPTVHFFNSISLLPWVQKYVILFLSWCWISFCVLPKEGVQFYLNKILTRGLHMESKVLSVPKS